MAHARDHHHHHPRAAVAADNNNTLVVTRFKSRHGRNPTPQELDQLWTHGHVHEVMKAAGSFSDRPMPTARSYHHRAFTVGIGGPVGSGKTALMLQLCQSLQPLVSVVVVTNDIFTQEDGEFLIRHKALAKERIVPIETGGCPHAAIREDISANLHACEALTQQFEAEIVLVESGGDNLAATFSRELADFIIYVIDVAGGDKVPRKGGPGITQADLLVINKIDLASQVGADLKVMAQDAQMMRGSGPTIFSVMKTGEGVDEIVAAIEAARTRAATAARV